MSSSAGSSNRANLSPEIRGSQDRVHSNRSAAPRVVLRKNRLMPISPGHLRAQFAYDRRLNSILTIGAILTRYSPNATHGCRTSTSGRTGGTSTAGSATSRTTRCHLFGSQESERFVVEQQTASRKVLLQVYERRRSGDQQDRRSQSQQPGQSHLGRGIFSLCAVSFTAGASRTGFTVLKAEPRGKNGT